MTAFFTDEQLEHAKLSELAEARAKSGWCPKCQQQKLRHFYAASSVVFRQCVECRTVVALTKE